MIFLMNFILNYNSIFYLFIATIIIVLNLQYIYKIYCIIYNEIRMIINIRNGKIN